MPGDGVRYDCKESGVCFNDEHRLRFGVFDDCWQRLNGRGEWMSATLRPSDCDMLVEQGNRFLLMEWKYNSGVFSPRSGQGKAFRRIVTRAPITVILCEGSSREMDVRRIELLHGHYDSGVIDTNTDGLKRILKRWSRWADQNPAQENQTPRVGIPSWLPADYAEQIRPNCTE